MGAGLLFQALWKWQNLGRRGVNNALRRATWTALPSAVILYAFVMVFSNVSVWIQLSVLLPVVAAIFIALLVVNEPSINPSERDRQFLLSTTVTFSIISTLLGAGTIMAIYVSPDLPSVLPDHNLVRSWELDFAAMGITRAEALDRVNLGYMWHAMYVFAYVVFILGGNLLIAMFRMRGRAPRSHPLALLNSQWPCRHRTLQPAQLRQSGSSRFDVPSAMADAPHSSVSPQSLPCSFCPRSGSSRIGTCANPAYVMFRRADMAYASV